MTYVGYLCANFNLPKPLCSRLRPDVRDRRQTKASLNVPPIRGGGIINSSALLRLESAVIDDVTVTLMTSVERPLNGSRIVVVTTA